jgi:hypothetical protein
MYDQWNICDANTLTHLSDARLALSLYGPCPAVQNRSPGQPICEPLLRRQSYRCLCLLMHRQRLAAELMQERRKDQSQTQAIGVRDLLSEGACFLAVLQGLVGIASCHSSQGNQLPEATPRARP